MIKIDMQMPECCVKCPFYCGSRSGGECIASDYGLYFAGTNVSVMRHYHCPLEEVEDDA